MSQQVSTAPYLIVPDVIEAAEYYRDTLGFSFRQYWGEPPSFTILNRDGITIMVKQNPGDTPALPNPKIHENACWDAYIWVDDVDALYHDFKARGANITREIEDTFYGCRDFDLRDLNGYTFGIGQDLDAD